MCYKKIQDHLHTIIQKIDSETYFKDDWHKFEKHFNVVYADFIGNPSKAIYFDNEGHTINYQISYSEKAIIFQSEKMPNIPIFRLTYSLLDNNMVNTKFEMSQDGENFMTYIEGKSKNFLFNYIFFI